MFEYLKKFRKIIVTGSNRSGTRICARMISYDLGYPYIDENDIHIDSMYTFCHYLFDETPYVIQCPALSRHIHFFSSENRAIIFMKRKTEDIISSQQRINWSWEWLEKLKYDKINGKISEIKNSFLKKVQKERIVNLFEINYKSLSSHPLWIEKKKRNLFSPNQYLFPDTNNRKIQQLYPLRAPGANYHSSDVNLTAILINSEQNLKQINSAGIKIWEQCTGKIKVEDIVKKIESGFRENKKINMEQDIIKFILELSKTNFIQFLRFPLSG